MKSKITIFGGTEARNQTLHLVVYAAATTVCLNANGLDSSGPAQTIRVGSWLLKRVSELSAVATTLDQRKKFVSTPHGPCVLVEDEGLGRTSFSYKAGNKEVVTEVEEVHDHQTDPPFDPNFCPKSPDGKHKDAGGMFMFVCAHCGDTDDHFCCT